MKLTLDIWRQKSPSDSGGFVRYQVVANEHMSFLEMLDVLNQDLISRDEEPVAFDSDCREGVCGMCGFVINGSPHGPVHGSTVCQLHMRHFKDGDVLLLEPFRARAFPLVKDLVVDRSALDRIIRAGGFISTRTGSAPEANSILVPKPAADRAMEAAACIGCGACVAACPNASASLFTAAKVAHLGLLPQGQPERRERVLTMVEMAAQDRFGHCTLMGECEAVCPAHVPLEVIPRMNGDFLRASLKKRDPSL
ncbi:MAG TPA: succinate dehydrogenase/fumarate reductase iron-sulfur subunit [Anaeromyxobacteraceae bacterium]|nr:succinate dehydrogenase/fumarate reductase iron-sulfur subunit [Anaeromyxobacteraceae bacterium]